MAGLFAIHAVIFVVRQARWKRPAGGTFFRGVRSLKSENRTVVSSLNQKRSNNIAVREANRCEQIAAEAEEIAAWLSSWLTSGPVFAKWSRKRALKAL